MFNVGGGELLVIALVALIVLGPQRLPEAARTAGRVIGEIRRLSSGFQREIREALEDTESTTKSRPGAKPLAAAVAEVDAGSGDDAGDEADAGTEADAGDERAGSDRPGDNNASAETAGDDRPTGETAGSEHAGSDGAASGDADGADATTPETAGSGAGGTDPGGLAPEIAAALDQITRPTAESPSTTPAGPDRPATGAARGDRRSDGAGDARAAS